MKILYIAHRIPYPPNKGDKIRSFNTIKHLALSHDVWCACFVDDAADLQHIQGLSRYCRQVVAIPISRRWATVRGALGLATGGTLSESFYSHGKMRSAVRRLADSVRFDAVVAFSSSMGQYGLMVDAPRRVIDFCDLDSRKWADCAKQSSGIKSRLLAVESERLAKREERLVHWYDATVLIGQHEVEGWDTPFAHKLRYVGNGVGIPVIDEPCVYDSHVVGFVGDMRYQPNEDAVCWFVKKIWPRIHQKRKNARLQIVGRGPSKRVRDLRWKAGVSVIGEVECVAALQREFQVAIAPLRIARGIQNKVLEAMALARPVVATTAAAKGIDGIVGEDFVVADKPSVFADEVLELLGDQERCRRIGESGRQFVIRNHDWDTEIARLAALLHPRRGLRDALASVPNAVGTSFGL